VDRRNGKVHRPHREQYVPWRSDPAERDELNPGILGLEGGMEVALTEGTGGEDLNPFSSGDKAVSKIE
jgi:hypothetical protein